MAAQDLSVESLYWLDKLQSTQLLSVGQTALGLARLIHDDLPVLPGLLLSTTVLQQYCRSIPWSSPFLGDFPQLSLHLQPEQPLQLQAVADEIYQGFKITPFPPSWLQANVAELQHLSSGCLRLTPSLALPLKWAESTAQISRMLSVQYCQPTQVSIEQAVKRVWSDLFTAQALFLMQQLAIPINQVRVGIVFQPMELAQVSGFLAVTDTHVQIQATPGLSQSIMTGEVIPDLYSCDRQTESWQKEIGHITCSYQATTIGPMNRVLSRADGLVSTALNPKAETAYVLGQEELAQLLTLAKGLPLLAQSSPVIEWMLAAGASRDLKIVSVWPETPLPMPLLGNPSDLLGNVPNTTDDQALEITQGLAAAIGQVTATVTVLQSHRQVQSEQVVNQIVVLDRVVPADVVWLQQVAGLICTTGGYTSHGAIMARELGVPAIVGATSALEVLQSGQVVQLDGTKGKVYAAPRPLRRPTAVDRHTDPELEPLQTQVWINLSQPKLLKRALQLPVQGVGLLRAEWFLLDICQGYSPYAWIQEHSATEFVEYLSQHLQSFGQAWQPRPVFYRSLDIVNDALAHSSHKQNRGLEHSMLGLRGASHYVYDSTLFDLELQALAHLYRQGCQNLRLILPFVRSVEEFIFCRDRIQAAELNIEVWMMAEVPAVLFQLPAYVEAGVQGIVIGTSDLTQLLLGVDRDHSYLTQQHSENHPAVVAAMSQLVKTAQQLGIPCSICGLDPVRYPDLMGQLIEWGITAISVDMAAVAETRAAIFTVEQRLRTKNNPAFHPKTTQND